MVTKEEAIKGTDENMDKVMAGLAMPNFQKSKVAEAIKKAVAPLLEKEGATGGFADKEAYAKAMREAIVKAVEDTAEKEEPPKDEAKRKAFDEKLAKDKAELEKSAGALADKLVALKETDGPNAKATFEKRMDAASPTLPVSNATLIGGGAAAAAALLAGDSLGNWTSFKGIAIKLGIIAAGIGVGAYISGDYKAVLPAKKKDDPAATPPR